MTGEAMRRALLAATLLGVLATPALAKDLQFWNQTSKEFSGVYLAPVGTTKWGPNQALNDPDRAVSADERLKITGVVPGSYDVKLVEASGRTCIVSGVEVKGAGKVAFAIGELQLTHCTP
jgi:hypothetical protein